MTRFTTPLAISSLLVMFTAAASAGQEPADTDLNLVASCAQCHKDAGASIPGWPPLNSLSRAELIGKLTAYRNQQVPDSRMGDVTHNFTDSEIEKIADYFSK